MSISFFVGLFTEPDSFAAHFLIRRSRAGISFDFLAAEKQVLNHRELWAFPLAISQLAEPLRVTRCFHILWY